MKKTIPAPKNGNAAGACGDSMKAQDEPSEPTPVVHAGLSRGQFQVLAALILAPWVIFALIFSSLRGGGHLLSTAPTTPVKAAFVTSPSNDVAAPKTARSYFGNTGLWGRLEYTRIAIEPPLEFIASDQPDHEFGSPRWFFKDFSKEQALTFCSKAGLSEPQFAALKAATWEVRSDGCAVKLDEDLVLGLSATARANIYLHLNQFPANKPQSNPYSFRPELLDERLEGSGLSNQTIEQFKKLLYPGGPLMLFADLDRLLPRLPSNEEKVRFLKMVARRTTLLAQLRIHPDSKLDDLVRYWSVGGRAKDLRPLLESMARVPGGCDIDIMHLLPHFARRRLYSYPFPGNHINQVPPDCHWTTFNFFSDQPDDRYAQPALISRTLNEEYYQIARPTQLGDVVVLLHPQHDQAIHSATFIADEVVFTKNGSGNKQPWVLMSMTNMVDIYSAHYPPDKPPEVVFMRSKKL